MNKSNSYLTPEKLNTQNLKKTTNKENLNPKYDVGYFNDKSTVKNNKNNLQNDQNTINNYTKSHNKQDILVKDFIASNFKFDDTKFNRNQFKNFLLSLSKYNRNENGMKLFNHKVGKGPNDIKFSLNHIIPIKTWINIISQGLLSFSNKDIIELLKFVYDFVSQESLISQDLQQKLQNQICSLFNDTNSSNTDSSSTDSSNTDSSNTDSSSIDSFYKELLYFFAYYPNNIAYAPYKDCTSKKIPNVGDEFDPFHSNNINPNLYRLLSKIFTDSKSEKIDLETLKQMLVHENNSYKYNSELFIFRDSPNFKLSKVMVYTHHNKPLETIKKRDILIDKIVCNIKKLIDNSNENQEHIFKTICSHDIYIKSFTASSKDNISRENLIKTANTLFPNVNHKYNILVNSISGSHVKKDIVHINSLLGAKYYLFNKLHFEEIAKDISNLQSILSKESKLLQEMTNAVSRLLDLNVLDKDAQHSNENNFSLNINDLILVDKQNVFLLGLINFKNDLSKKYGSKIYSILVDTPLKEMKYNYQDNLQEVSKNLFNN
jgi:hypothetical protein